MMSLTLTVENTAPSDTFCQLYNRHVERIYRYHLARTGSPREAEDLTAETFFAAWESFANLHVDSAPGSPDPTAAWLVGIARHKLTDHFRRSLFRGKPRAVPLEVISRFPAPEPNPEEAAGERLEMAKVAGALRRLNPERAEALALHYFAGMTVSEAAQVMGKSEEAAKKLVQRGLAELQQILRVPPAASGRK